MSRLRSGSLVGGILLCHLLGFAAFLVSAILRQPSGLVAGYQWNHALLQSLADLIDAMPAFTIAGTMVACSLLAQPTGALGGRAQGTVEAMVRPAVVTFLVLALVFTGLSGIAAPSLRRSLLGMDLRSVEADGYLDAMKEAVARAQRTDSAADYRAASDAASRYLEIDPEDGEIARLETEYRREYLERRFATAAAARTSGGEGSARAESGADGDDPVELLRKAEAFYKEADYYSAHFFATLAQRSPEVRVRAAALVEAAELEISPSTPLGDKATPAERWALERARNKRDAWSLYERGEWLSAYYRFGELAALYPEDRDVLKYHGMARDKVLDNAFPIGEAREALRLPGTEGILYTVDRAEKGLEVVSMRKMVRAPSGVFFSDVELLRLSPGRGPTLHLYARYGKLSGRLILLHAVDPVERSDSEAPVVTLQTDPTDLTVSLEAAYEPETLGYLSPDPSALRAVPAGMLWSIRPWASRSGLLGQAVDLELILFFVRPAMFLSLCMLALAAAMRHRARYYGRPAPVAFVSFALFPYAAAGAWQLALDAARVLTGAVLVAAGFVPTAIAAGLLQAALAAVALVVLARAISD